MGILTYYGSSNDCNANRLTAEMVHTDGRKASP